MKGNICNSNMLESQECMASKSQVEQGLHKSLYLNLVKVTNQQPQKEIYL